MAAIDASIYGQIQAPKLESPLNALAQVAQVRNAQNQNRLFDMKVAESDRALADDDAVRAAYALDDPAARSNALRSASPKAYREEQTFQTTQSKALREAENAKLDGTIKKLSIAGQVYGAVAQNPSLDTANAALDSLGQQGIYTPEQVAQYKAAVAQDPSPERIKALATQAMTVSMDAGKQLDLQMKEREFGYRQQNDSAQRDVQIRGQDMTDTRARDLNATKVEENNLKREAKQETADLTKNSQLASFDTMLGTLDRLSAHKGLGKSVGLYSKFPTTPGSDSANFQAELNAFQSQAFLPMVAQLKGMGALSDAEGKKLTAAVGALDLTMSEEAFKESVGRIIKDMNAARARMVGGEAKPTPPSGVKDGAVGKSKSGKPIVMRNGQWEYQ